MEESAIRILHVVTDMRRGGLESMLMNYYRKINRAVIQFDFLMHRETETDFTTEIIEMGGYIYHLPRLNPFSPKYLRALGIFFEEHPEYKIIHVHQDCMSGVILKAAKNHGVTVRIAHSHSSSQTKDLKYPLKLLYRHMIPRYATHMLACSEAAGRWMFCGASFHVLKNAINASLYRFDTEKRKEMRRVFGLHEDELLAGHVGRFSPPKNHLFLLNVFAEIHRQVDAKLLLVGDGVLREEIEKKIHDLGLDNDVILTGVRTDIPDLLQMMDVFLFPSIYEGLPVTVVEAQASGLPVLVSDKVPLECKFTDLVQQISLEAGADEWAKKAISASHTLRGDTSGEVKNAGFDVVEQAEKLVLWYTDLYRESVYGKKTV